MVDKVAHVNLDNPTCKSAEHFIKMVGIGDLLGCTIMGPPGMGKTHLIEHVLCEMDIEYVKYGGHITLAETYEFLFENSDKLIFFDDVSQVITKPEIMELLKQAMGETGRGRWLNYRSKGVLSGECPPKFEFEGRCIFAFNAVDKGNPNVQAIIDRAPLIELKFSRKDTFDAMDSITTADEVGGLPEHEKLIVTDEIKTYAGTDTSLDLSLRKQALCFKIFNSFKRLYGEGNTDWINEVHKCIGKRRETWMVSLVRELCGEDKVLRKILAKEIALRRNMSIRNAQRWINDFLEMEQIFRDKLKFGNISLHEFNKK